MTDHPLTTSVSEFYDDLDVKLNFNTRVNYEDLPDGIKTIVEQLSKTTMARYYGSGIVIPENIKGARILDIGCGSGSLVFILSKLVGPDGHVVGIDISKGLIETCKKEIDFHTKAWGYAKPNVEFHPVNAERLQEMGFNSFDIVVSNGVFCLIPDQQKAFKNVYNLLKPGGQFYINDVYTDIPQPDENKNNKRLFALGTGAMVWTDLKKFSVQEGFTTPYLTQTYPVDIPDEEIKKKLLNAQYVCSAYRLFKIPPDEKRGAATVIYKGNIENYPESFQWDFDLAFPTGQGVNVDAELATILQFTMFKDSFTMKDFSGSVTNKRNQDPFQYLADLLKQGKNLPPIYKVEDH